MRRWYEFILETVEQEGAPQKSVPAISLLSSDENKIRRPRCSRSSTIHGFANCTPRKRNACGWASTPIRAALVASAVPYRTRAYYSIAHVAGGYGWNWRRW